MNRALQGRGVTPPSASDIEARIRDLRNQVFQVPEAEVAAITDAIRRAKDRLRERRAADRSSRQRQRDEEAP